jgi:hypothetical protein
VNDAQRFQYLIGLRKQSLEALRERLAEVESAIEQRHPRNPGDWYFERLALQTMIEVREQEANGGAEPCPAV